MKQNGSIKMSVNQTSVASHVAGRRSSWNHPSPHLLTLMQTDAEALYGPLTRSYVLFSPHYFVRKHVNIQLHVQNKTSLRGGFDKFVVLNIRFNLTEFRQHVCF